MIAYYIGLILIGGLAGLLVSLSAQYNFKLGKEAAWKELKQIIEKNANEKGEITISLRETE